MRLSSIHYAVRYGSALEADLAIAQLRLSHPATCTQLRFRVEFSQHRAAHVVTAHDSHGKLRGYYGGDT